jgi:uncharacterized membrane protein YdjX (TVP38/TMEM64 family)
LPASVFLVAIGTLLGPVWGSFWAIIACNLASLIIFLGARKIGLKTVQNKLGNNWEKFNSKMEEDGFFYVALVRSSLMLPFSVICYGAAITSIRTSDYIKASLIGTGSQILVFCYTVPMIISQNLSTKNIVILGISTIAWLLVSGLVYSLHKKQKNNLQSITAE